MIGIFIIARLASKRLPQKHLIDVGELTLIEVLIKRILFLVNSKIESNEIKLVIATSDERINRKFETYKERYPIDVFYGNCNNIPLRLLECSESFNCENIVAVDGDDILCSMDAIGAVYNSLANGKDVVKTTGLPLGMNSIGFKSKILSAAVKDFSDLPQLETGWGMIFENYNEIKSEPLPEYNKYRFTLDYKEDAEFFIQVINRLGVNTISATDAEIIAVVDKHKLFEINSNLNDKYWANFNKEKQKNIDGK